MPLFEYRCTSCATINEVLVGVGTGSDEKFQCERCGSTDLTKLLSRINIGRSLAAFNAPCGESSCPAPGGGCCGGACQGH